MYNVFHNSGTVGSTNAFAIHPEQ